MKKFILTLLLLSTPVAAFGVEKPIISVGFKITQENYRAALRADIRSIEETCTKNIIEALENYFGFLKFTERPSSHKLLIELDNKNRKAPISSSQLHEVGFWITISDASASTQASEVYSMFRPEQFYNRDLGSKKAFIEEVSSVFRNALREKHDTLVRRLLSKIVIAWEALPIPERSWWILPFKKENFMLERDSEFNIDTEVDDQGIIITKKYRTITKGKTTERTTIIPLEYRQGMIVTKVKEPSISSNEMNNKEDIVAIKVYIIKYIRSGKEIKTKPPEKLTLHENEGN